MQIGLSNISWNEEENDRFIDIANKAGYSYIECAYNKIWEGMPVLAIQSIFYGSSTRKFQDKDCHEYLKKVINTCEEKEIKTITLGSPSMRTGDKEDLLSLMNKIDKYLENKDITLCIEPNSKEYGGKYFHTLQEIVNNMENLKNVKTMIDVGNSLMENQDVFKEYSDNKEVISHIHFAAPNLKSITDYGLYKEFYQYLTQNKYNGLISYEFLYSENREKAIRDFYERIIL